MVWVLPINLRESCPQYDQSIENVRQTMKNTFRLSMSMIHPVLIICFIFISLVAEGYGKTNRDTGTGEVSSVIVHHIIDGDSLAVVDRGKLVEIRLWGIDAPEYDQPGSEQAKARISGLTETGRAEIFIKDRDRYGRTVVLLECNGINVNEEMVASGHAWVHVYYCKDSICRKWKKLERDARNNHLGLWQWENPIEPWIWKSNR